nr:MAG TPA: hypothetical protein [Caudoviricetes sp.]
MSFFSIDTKNPMFKPCICIYVAEVYMPDYSRVYIPNSLKQYVYICQNDTYTLALYMHI